MPVRAKAAATAAATTFAVLGGIAAPAHAAGDTTPPRLKLPVEPAFVVGSQISAAVYDDSYAMFTKHIRQRLRWDAHDASGICGYDVARTFAGADPERVLTRTKRTSFTGTITDYDGSLGGGAVTMDGWAVTAHDCAGNSTTRYTGPQPEVTQQSGQSATMTPHRFRPRYTGLWKVARCGCFSGGTAQRTSAKGAAMSFAGRYRLRDNHVALVMSKGPARGRAAVYVDGVRRATVNTHAAKNMNRIVVWQTWLSKGRHRVTLVNQATPGHPWIHVDAILTN